MRHTVLVAMVALAPALSAQATGQCTREQIRASYDAHQGDFDYLLGDWEFSSVSREFGKGRELLECGARPRSVGAGLDRGRHGIAEHRHRPSHRGGNAHRAEVRRDEPEPVDLADPLLRHRAGPFLLDRRSLHGWWKDVDTEVAADRGSPHRAAAAPRPARN